MPYRVETPPAGDDVLDRLIDLGALDLERSSDRRIAALMPDGVAPDRLSQALGGVDLTISPAVGRDDGSVWVLSPRPVRAAGLSIVPAGTASGPGVLQLADTPAFGTGLHPTTRLCLDALDDTMQIAVADAVLDVGTGSGILALAALTLGVTHACGIDIDDGALRAAAENARRNGLIDRLTLMHGGPEVVTGTWPLVLANVLAGPLVEMAPALVRRIGHGGRLVLSGMPASLGHEVGLAYQRLGMRRIGTTSRAGWTAVVMQASW
jgi:ribosomal protein L11 methyltransferase